MTFRTPRSISKSIVLLFLAGMVAWSAPTLLAAPPASIRHTSPTEPRVDPAEASIRVEDLKSHAYTLASDTLEGREAGSRGGQAAAAYILTRLRKLGVKGGGDKESYFQEFQGVYKNILAIVPGSDPKLSKEWIVVSAHYDHVGYGTQFNSRGPIGQIHNGADDNASGVSTVLEVLEAVKTSKTPFKRSLLFIFFDAEEKGLLGSEHWVRNPTVPLKNIRVALNIDMIGRLQKSKRVEVYGTRTAPGLRKAVSTANLAGENGLTCDFNWNMIRESDHYPLFQFRVPVLMFHTGKHDDYHRPSDDPQKLNFAGMRDIAVVFYRLLTIVANSTSEAEFRADSFQENEATKSWIEAPLAPSPDRLGAQFDSLRSERKEFRVLGVETGSPAAQAGLRLGDRIVTVNGKPAKSLDAIEPSLLAAREKIALEILRQGEMKPRSLEIKLRGQPQRIGLTWRIDEGEPGCAIVRSVIPGSPAARAGLTARDRIHSIAGENFRTSDDIRRLIYRPKDLLKIVYERQGKIKRTNIQVLTIEDPAAAASATAK